MNALVKIIAKTLCQIANKSLAAVHVPPTFKTYRGYCAIYVLSKIYIWFAKRCLIFEKSMKNNKSGQTPAFNNFWVPSIFT